MLYILYGSVENDRKISGTFKATDFFLTVHRNIFVSNWFQDPCRFRITMGADIFSPSV